MNSILLFNTSILTMDSEGRQFNDGAILIQGNRILKVGRSADLLSEVDDLTERIDLRGRWVLPGLHNTHVHTSQQLGRGLGDDVDLMTWLHKRIWPFESSLTEEDSYISTLLCGLELIRSGVTCFAEAAGHFVDGIGRAVTELGIRGVLTHSTMDEGEGLPARWNQNVQQLLDIQVAHYERWHNSANGRIRVWFNLRTIFNNSDELILKTKKLANGYGVGIHMHVAELPAELEYATQTRGATTATHLDRLGVCDKNLLAIHCTWLSDKEIQMFADRGVKVSYCPSAGLRYLGFAKIPEMIRAGVCVSLGTDGAPSNNRMTLIDEMWVTSNLHKGRLLDPTVMPAEAVLKMATIDGARSVLWDDEIGSLEIGKKADLIVINPNTATMLPLHDPVSNLVSAMRSHNVESVMVDGRWIMREQRILTINEEEILELAKAHAAEIRKRAGIELPDRFKVVG
jgi:5-methylthioadenosine/S-adenosylhomocysteine deaminase